MQQGKASPGSGDVLVLVNGATPQFLRLAETAVLAALRHLGAPLHVHDVALGLGQALAQPAACIVIGSPGALARLSPGEREALLACVQAGTGLVNFDGDSPLPQFCPEPAAWQPVERVVASAARHYCLATREPGDTVALQAPLSAPRLSLPPGCQALLEDGGSRRRS